MFSKLLSLVALLLLVSCGEPVPKDGSASILLMGDSLMSSNKGTKQSVGDVIEATMDQPVIDRSVAAASYFHALPISGAAGLNIAQQYRSGSWDWVVMNGGGNDLLLGCACGRCDGTLDRLVSKDGQTGAIPVLVRRMRQDGAQIIYTGYLRNPGVQTLIKSCGAAGNELDRRMQRLAASTPGLYYVLLADLVPNGDTSLHQIDLIHPSAKGSQQIARRILKVMQAQGR